jgi:hypothetical protein
MVLASIIGRDRGSGKNFSWSHQIGSHHMVEDYDSNSFRAPCFINPSVAMGKRGALAVNWAPVKRSPGMSGARMRRHPGGSTRFGFEYSHHIVVSHKSAEKGSSISKLDG